MVYESFEVSKLNYCHSFTRTDNPTEKVSHRENNNIEKAPTFQLSCPYSYNGLEILDSLLLVQPR